MHRTCEETGTAEREYAVHAGSGSTMGERKDTGQVCSLLGRHSLSPWQAARPPPGHSSGPPARSRTPSG